MAHSLISLVTRLCRNLSIRDASFAGSVNDDIPSAPARYPHRRSGVFAMSAQIRLAFFISPALSGCVVDLRFVCPVLVLG
jgi:hypothetical protein